MNVKAKDVKIRFLPLTQVLFRSVVFVIIYFCDSYTNLETPTNNKSAELALETVRLNAKIFCRVGPSSFWL